MRKMFILVAMLSFAVNAFAGSIVAGIEIGSKGIKALAYDVSGFDDEEQYIAKKVYDKKINPTIMSGVTDGYLKEEKIEEASNAVKVLFNEMKRLDPQYIVVVSSTAFDKIKNKSALENAVYEKIGQRIAFIQSDEEMYYGLLSSVPQKRLNQSILIDIGSGNTKIGYSTPMSSNGFESKVIKYGTVTLKETAQKMGGDYKSNVNSIINNEIRPALKEAMQNQPGIANVNRRIYIVGGASWATTNFARPQDIEKRFVRVPLKDLQNANNRFIDNNFATGKIPAKAEAELSNIMDVFSLDDLQAGSTLLTAILSDINGAQRKIIFPREGGWLVGYMFAKYSKGN